MRIGPDLSPRDRQGAADGSELPAWAIVFNGEPIAFNGEILTFGA